MLASSRPALASCTSKGCVCPVRQGARRLHSPNTHLPVQVRVAAVRAPGLQEQQRDSPQQQLARPEAKDASHVNGSEPTNGLKAWVRFKAYFNAQFGDTVKVVGSAPELGAWDTTQALPLAWTEGASEHGDLWTGEVQLAAGDCDFKVIVQTATDVLWEPGENRAAQVPELLPSEVLVAELVYGKQELMEPPVAVEVAAAPAEADAAAGAAEPFAEEAPAEPATAPDTKAEPEAAVAVAADTTAAAADTEVSAQPVHVVQQQEAAPEQAPDAGLAVGIAAEGTSIDLPAKPAGAKEVDQAAEVAQDAETAGAGPLTTMFDDSAAQSALKKDVAQRAEAELEQHTQAISLAAAIAAAATAAGEPAPAARPETSQSTPAAAAAAGAAEESPVPGTPAPAAAQASGNKGAELFGAVLGTAAVATVLYSEFVLKQTGCGLPPGPSGLIGAAEGVSYLAVLGLAGAGTVRRAQGHGGLPGALLLPELLSYVAVAVGLGVLYLQVQDHGYIPPVLPGGACYADSAAVSLPALPSFSLPTVTMPST